jgi:hypothetical protein
MIGEFVNINTEIHPSQTASPASKRPAVVSTAPLISWNQIANRLYKAPVVFLEPYVMNSSPVWKRVQMGDYSGVKSVDGASVPSLVSEYTWGVAEGLVRYYSQWRTICAEP